jgi:hypothetical protein
MHQKYAAKGLAAISVSVDTAEDRAKAEKFLVKQKATFTNLWLDEPEDVWKAKFKINTVPCVYVFDRRGKWVQFNSEGANDVEYADVEKLVVKLLAE